MGRYFTLCGDPECPACRWIDSEAAKWRREAQIWWADVPRMTLSDHIAYNLARDRARMSRVKSSYRLRRNHR